MDEAAKILENTTQEKVRTNNPRITKNCGTNDRMLQSKKITEYFFMDTLIATSESRKSIRGNACGQLFVIDK